MKTNQYAIVPKVATHEYLAAGVILFICILNYVDRSLLSILQIPIKTELHISDSQIGLLTGLAFAVLYTFLGVPVARFADRSVRKYVLAVALIVWTLSTASCGLATNFKELLFCRMGVAIGEAGCVSTSLSLLVDLFPRQLRPHVMAGWAVATSTGIMLAFFAGGWLAHFFDWRISFIIIGMFGLLFVPLVTLYVKEPERGRYDVRTDITPVIPSFFRSIAVLWNLRAYRFYCPAAALIGYVQYATTTWSAPFYSRVHHMPLKSIATYLAFSIGLSGIAGSILSASLVKRLQHRSVSWYLWIPAIAAIICVPFGLGQYFVHNLTISLILGIIPAMMLQVFLTPGNVIMQSIVQPNMRSFITSVSALIGNLVGIGLGPLFTGMLSDHLIRRYGMVSDSLRYAISLQLFVALIAAGLFFRAAKYLPAEMHPLHR
jgi:predicted MFS family arabinose efflux permease